MKVFWFVVFFGGLLMLHRYMFYDRLLMLYLWKSGTAPVKRL